MTKNELEKLADEIMSLGRTLLEKAPIAQEEKIQGGASALKRYNEQRSRYLFRQITPPDTYISYSWGIIDGNLKTLQAEATQKYQQFYSSAHQLIKECLPDREAEFVENYHGKHEDGVFEYLNLTTALYNNDKALIINGFEKKLNHQKSILLSIEIDGGIEHNRMHRNDDTAYKIAVITASKDELLSVLSLLESSTQIENQDDSNLYHVGILKNSSIEVIVTISPFQGMVPATCTTTKLILQYKPRYIFMVGIAAGRKGSVKLGDILIAEESLDYNRVVVTENKKGEITEKLSQSPSGIDVTLKNKLTAFATKDVIMQQIYRNYPECHELNANGIEPPKCCFGLIITGGSLVRSAAVMEEHSKAYHNIIGLDMETYGVYYAAQSALRDFKPICISIKAVSDFGDNNSKQMPSEKRRKYALYTSSRFFYDFLINTPL